MCLGTTYLGFGPLPAIIAIIFFLETVTIYTIAVIKGDVDPILPYISSAADKRPQSCIFAIGANISAFLLGTIVFIRQRQLRGIFTHREEDALLRWNQFSKWFGYIASVGMFIVANVQETAIIALHMTAAVSMFGGFTIYMMFQCWFTYKATPFVTRPTVFFYRLAFTILSTIAFFASFGFGIAASTVFHQTYPDLPTPRPWNRKFYQPGYELHQISALAEWTCAISQVFFLLSFMPEFEEITLSYYLRSDYIDRDNHGYEQYERDRVDYAL